MRGKTTPSAFNELRRLEALVDLMHEKHNLVGAEVSDPGLTKTTDEEIEA